MNIVGIGAAFCMGCCPNIHNGTATAAPAVWMSPPIHPITHRILHYAFSPSRTVTDSMVNAQWFFFKFSPLSLLVRYVR